MTLVSKGDVYITNVGACIGDCGTIPEKYDGANLTENAVKITELKCDSMFLVLFLSSNIVQQGIKSLIARATLGKLSIANIKKIAVFLPSEAEQQEIVRYLNYFLMKELQATKVVESIIAQITLMKKSILAKAFRGELGTNISSEDSAVGLLKEILREQTGN